MHTHLTGSVLHKWAYRHAKSCVIPINLLVLRHFCHHMVTLNFVPCRFWSRGCPSVQFPLSPTNSLPSSCHYKDSGAQSGSWEGSFPTVHLYCFQDDVVMGTMTVRENLHFSAALRLPSSISVKEKEQRVTQIISELGLSKVADAKVSSENTFLRNLTTSGNWTTWFWAVLCV